MTIPTKAAVEWSRNHFRMLAEGGTWAIPRSGMIFQKRGVDTLVLAARMPHDAEMPITADELDEQQRGEFEVIKLHFNAAGVFVLWGMGV